MLLVGFGLAYPCDTDGRLVRTANGQSLADGQASDRNNDEPLLELQYLEPMLFLVQVQGAFLSIPHHHTNGSVL